MASVPPHRFTCAAALVLLFLPGACSTGSGPNEQAQEAAPGAPASKTEGGETDSQGERQGSGNSKEPDTVELADDPAPEFEIQTFSGDTFAIREELGTPVVLNFWESW